MPNSIKPKVKYLEYTDYERLAREEKEAKEKEAIKKGIRSKVKASYEKVIMENRVVKALKEKEAAEAEGEGMTFELTLYSFSLYSSHFSIRLKVKIS